MTPDASDTLIVHRARVNDVRRIKDLVDEYAGVILLEKTLANLFEDVTEFWVAKVNGTVVGCGALHVLWEDLAEIRSVAVDPVSQGNTFDSPCVGASIEMSFLSPASFFINTFKTPS